jgi:outer membrane protein OmpA-like peptidoglycan-associated protein
MPRLRPHSSLLPVAVAVLALVGAADARAQASDVPGERLRPATTSAGVIDVESGAVTPHLGWNATLWGAYALDPLVVYRGNERLGAFVGHRVGSDIVFSLGLFDWIELAADLPVIVYQASDPGSLGDAAPAISAFGLGDVRLAPKIRLLRASEQLVDLAIIPALSAPTGTPANESFTGEGQFTFLPELAVSRRFDDGVLAGLVVAGNALARIRPEEKALLGTPFGHEFVGRLGVGYRLHERLDVPLRIDLSSSLGTPLLAPFSTGDVTGAELMAALTADVLRLPAVAGAGDGLVVQAFGGGAFGLAGGAGTPAARAFIGLRAEKPADIDLDDDFVADKDDQCPGEAEDKDGHDDSDGCPDPDNDGDGVVDGVDVCRDVAEDDDGFEDDDGCPDPDNDGDAILDADDTCPKEAGPKENAGCPWPDADNDGTLDKDDRCPSVPGVAALGGCPDQDGDGVTDLEDACPALAGPKTPYDGCPDTDGDGFTDDKDKCPTEAETVNNVDDDDGCPDQGKVLVSLQSDKIEILDKVFFDSGKATIQSKSFALLDQVVTVLRTHRELKKVRVEGHTDDAGPDDKNLALSQARADAVRAYLVERGIAAERLEAIGYGSTRPAAAGKGSKAREANRRVEFVIVH